MGDYISELLSVLWSGLLSITDIQSIILLVISIVLFIVPSFGSIKPKEWNFKMIWDKFKNFWRSSPYRWVVVLLIISIWIFNAQYGLYKEKQNQILDLQNKTDMIQEEHRPIIKIDATFKEGTEVDTSKSATKYTLNVNLVNLGDRAGYQTKVLAFASPIFEPDKIHIYPEFNLINPIFAEDTGYGELAYIGNYSIQGDYGIVLMYIYLKYSNQPDGGTWYEEEFWLTPTIEFNTKKITMEQNINLAQWIKMYRPYVDNMLSE